MAVRPSFPILLLLLVLAFAGGAFWWSWQMGDGGHVRVHPQGDWHHASRGADGPLPLEELLLRLDVPARSRILEVEREKEGGRLLYEIELLLPDGRVEELLVDPRTADVVKREFEDEE